MGGVIEIEQRKVVKEETTGGKTNLREEEVTARAFIKHEKGSGSSARRSFPRKGEEDVNVEG